MAEIVLERRTCPEGEKIFREGEPGNKAFILQTGGVKIVKTVDGKEVVLGTVRQGAIIGEMALIDDSPRMASAIATEVTTYIIVTRQMFETKLAKTDPFIRALLKIFAESIRTLSAKLAAAGPTAAAEVAAASAHAAAKAPDVPAAAAKA